ncbi:heterokaryon incompatibility protein [Colletotrichum truncatum]|uniref:Heterokaryon incompatibility protein n=1 Tax=Colletotrichum truncatum TaxID=5467 RepID=A0ACC3Z101_COLTU
MTPKTYESYEYQALSATDSVRLLRISRDDEQPHGMLLSLTEASLADDPHFAALSYTWQLPQYDDTREGRASRGLGETYEVVCDGKMMAISENLFGFLRAVLHARAGDSRVTRSKLTAKVHGFLDALPVWIDAFCINQGDNEEKRHQVLLMHRIYSSAQKVIVWLGPTEPDPDVVWVHDKFIPAISRLTQRRLPGFVETHLKSDPVCSSPEVVAELGSEICFRWTSAWMAFNMFIYGQRWFDRGWVVQEVALADPAVVYVLCGRSTFSWKRLTAFAQFLGETGWNDSLLERLQNTGERYPYPSNRKKMEDMANVSDRLLKMSQARRTLAEVAKQTGLLEEHAVFSWNREVEQAWFTCANVLVHSLRSSDFQDKRDHIYGCLGMLAILLPHSFPSPIAPDYDHSVPQVFASAAALFLRNMPMLMELSRAGRRAVRYIIGLPSWVPDYSCCSRGQHPTREKLFPLNRYNDMDLRQLDIVEKKIWGADLRRPVAQGFQLLVYGFRLTSISYVSVANSLQSQGFDMENRLMEFALDVANSVNPLLHGIFWNGLASVVLTMGTPNPSRFFPYQDVRFAGGDLSDVVCAEFAERYLYTTDSGALGLGPREVEVGDEIWMVEGAWAPFVLRRVKPKPEDKCATTEDDESSTEMYEFVGETDLQGFDIQNNDFATLEQRVYFQQIELV